MVGMKLLAGMMKVTESYYIGYMVQTHHWPKPYTVCLIKLSSARVKSVFNCIYVCHVGIVGLMSDA